MINKWPISLVAQSKRPRYPLRRWWVRLQNRDMLVNTSWRLHRCRVVYVDCTEFEITNVGSPRAL